MDFRSFAIDERLVRAVESLSVKTVFFEEMLEHAFLKNENVCAKIDLSEGKEEVCLLPALQWLATGAAAARGEPSVAAQSSPGEPIAPASAQDRRVLVVAPDAESARKAAASALRLGSELGLATCVALEGESAVSASPPALEGEPSSALVAGTPVSLLSAAQAGLLRLRDYGYLVVLGAERLADLPSEILHKLAGSLLPSWERRTVLACAKINVKTKNLAWDLADNPFEIHIEEEVVKVQGVPRETWYVAAEAKFRFLLGLLGREPATSLCVFCNLKGTAEEVSRRLEANGIGSDYLLGALPVDRKLAIFGKTRTGACRVLVLTDQGAEGLPPASFPLVVNYDIPLEPEYFVRRLELLDRGAPGAKAVNLACDRYIYGLTAVEQYIDAKLEATTADDSLLAAGDKSEGMVFERGGPRGRGGRREDTRREETRREDTRRGHAQGDYRRRDEDRRNAGRRDSPNRDDPRRDDRSPAIRRSISEATGGSLDIDSVEPAAREADLGQGDSRRESSPAAGRVAGGRSAGRRDAHRRESSQSSPSGREGRRWSPQRGPSSHREDHRGGGRAPRGSTSGNPYDLPMEERMRRYREKYGRRLEGDRSEEARIAKIRDARARDEAGRDERRVASRPEPRPEGGSAPRAERPAGLLGKLKDVFKRKDK